ncbi:MAG: hypothetical protein HYZ56_00400 [Nitrosopumilales archaeon]|nr:hypothetical protein [Nitrosopumilales archaeon]
MKTVIFLIIFLIPLQRVFAQSDDLVPDVSAADLTVLFSVSSAIVIGLVIYLLRDSILRKKTTYDAKDFASKKDQTPHPMR